MSNIYGIVYKLLRVYDSAPQIAFSVAFSDIEKAKSYMHEQHLRCSREHYIAHKAKWDYDIWEKTSWNEIQQQYPELGDWPQSERDARQAQMKQKRQDLWKYWQEQTPEFQTIGERDQELLDMYQGTNVTWSPNNQDIYEIIEIELDPH